MAKNQTLEEILKIVINQNIDYCHIKNQEDAMENNKGEVCPSTKLKLSINGKDGTIRIGWGVADVLRDSQFLSIYLSPDNDAIMVKPCNEKEFLSVKIGSRKEGSIRKEIRMYSIHFVTELMDKNGWDFNQTYHMMGEYHDDYNAVVFYLKNARVLLPQN